MNASQRDLLDDLRKRGLVAQMTAEEQLIEHLSGASRTLYSGFDPTADSLHIGSLVPLLAMRRFQLAGHKPIALVGGATGLIGDPSFKAAERKLNTRDIVEQWVERLKLQVGQFLDFDAGNASAEVVNNLDWIGQLNTLDFLRDIGKHFSVNNMIQKDSVKQRLDRDGAGISYTEFSYMILQSLDFAELYKRFGCTLQIGGSDQWGNITGGIDLARRLHSAQVFGLTLPLVTKADGSKFGKTETGTIWLSPAKTSPYAFYQFWLNCSDADVYKFLRYFTFLDLEQIDAVEKADAESGRKPEAQGVLATEVCRLVHGENGLQAAKRISAAMFSGELDDLAESDLEQLRLDGLPSSSLCAADLKDKALTTLFSECGLAQVGREVKDALGRGAVSINGRPLGLQDNLGTAELFRPERGLYGRFFLVRLGKKKNHLFELSNSKA